MDHQAVENHGGSGFEFDGKLISKIDIISVAQWRILGLGDMPPLLQTPVVTAWDDVDAAVLRCGVVECDADGCQGRRFHWPIGRILVQGMSGSVQGGFEHQGAAEEQ